MSRTPLVQLVAFRPQLGALLLAVAVCAGPWRGRSRVAAGASVVGAAAVLRLRGRVRRGRPEELSTAPRVRVLAFNARRGRADVAALAAVIESARPDVVCLSEAGPDYVTRLLGPPGSTPVFRTCTSSAGRSPAGSLSMLVADRLGEVTMRAGTSRMPSVELRESAIGSLRIGSLRIVAAHPTAPRPGLVGDWRLDLAELGRLCSGPEPAVVAGDLNATLGRRALRRAVPGWSDAAAWCGHATTGMLPAILPRRLGTRIDHVLVPPGVGVGSFEVIDVPGSDHRAVLADLWPAGAR